MMPAVVTTHSLLRMKLTCLTGRHMSILLSRHLVPTGTIKKNGLLFLTATSAFSYLNAWVGDSGETSKSKIDFESIQLENPSPFFQTPLKPLLQNT